MAEARQELMLFNAFRYGQGTEEKAINSYIDGLTKRVNLQQ
jgi:hypothetical protein